MFAVVWHFWIAPILVIGAILTIGAIVAGYLGTVTAKQYPPRSQRKKQ